MQHLGDSSWVLLTLDGLCQGLRDDPIAANACASNQLGVVRWIGRKLGNVTRVAAFDGRTYEFAHPCFVFAGRGLRNDTPVRLPKYNCHASVPR